MTPHRTFSAGFSIVCLAFCAAAVQGAPPTAPPAGLREPSQNVHAIINAKIVVSPERTIDKGTLVLRDGVIVAVGEKVAPPADARVWNAEGKTLYPGLIDAYSELPDRTSRAPSSDEAGANYWNPHIVPQVKAHQVYASDAALNRRLRNQGITARLVAPSAGIIKGTSALVSSADDSGKQVILKDQVALHMKLTTSRGSQGYPNSPMGAFTLVRQAFYDAGWYGQAWDAYQQHPEIPRPERSDSLAVLRNYLGRKPPVIIDAADELYFLRADQVGAEFNLNVIVRGSGQEYQRLDDIKATGRPVILPLNFPRAPNVATVESALNTSLDRLMHWDLAPENPARLAAAGVKIAFTSIGLRESEPFLAAVRKAVKRGLKPEAALKALTVTPAELFDAADRLGTLDVGKAANFVVTSGDLFQTKTKVLETWVDGRRYEIETDAAADLRGTWTVEAVKPDGTTDKLVIELSGQPKKLSGKVTHGEKSTPLVSPSLAESQFTATFKGLPVGFTGVVQLSGTISQPASITVGRSAQTTEGELSWLGTIVWADGTHTACSAKQTAGAKRADTDRTIASAANKQPPAGTTLDENKEDSAKQDNADVGGAKDKDSKSDATPVETNEPTNSISPLNFPLGEFGRKAPPEQPKLVLFRNATIWTSGPQGRLEKADLLVESGKIRQVGPSLTAIGDALVIDASGKHISPGIIDCHSHVATDGGVNESGQTITAEVRIGDFINPNDINIYRQLAGGVTSSNILHGSANTIGGQNQVLKFRWGANPKDMKFAQAPPGIKFALGENVKQSARSERATATRYPQTRMGVEQLVCDALTAARQYHECWDAWNRTKVGPPPRIDLELEALAEVVEGKRMIHCHSYRQDEILALMRTCESFNIRIATFQHVLEGYKVAEVMARHGVGGSSFSDWWGFKFEAFDAIPYNGALLHNAGVVVSFNSDNAELARRLNLEAAKAVKYGGVPPEEALKFVTLNPAKQLKIDSYVGSLEVGKDADLVVWSGSPLSTSSRCEQTWIDGRRYFDANEDRQQRIEAAALHSALVQRILTSGAPVAGADEPQREVWPTEDEFCEHGDYTGVDH